MSRRWATGCGRWAAALALLVPGALHAQPGMPPDDPDSWRIAGTAKVLCSALFVSGRGLREAFSHAADYFLGQRLDSISDVHVDRERNLVRLTVANRITREAKRYGDQGCVIHQPGRDTVFFTPVPVVSRLPDAATTPWPMGDLLPATPFPADIDTARLRQAVDTAFGNPAGLTARLDWHRTTKSAYEVQCIEEATVLAARAFEVHPCADDLNDIAAAEHLLNKAIGNAAHGAAMTSDWPITRRERLSSPTAGSPSASTKNSLAGAHRTPRPASL